MVDLGNCKACGRPIVKDHEDKCVWCDAPLVKAPVPDPVPDTKENRIIRAKIATKKQQVDDIGQTGPVLTGLLGAFIFVIAIMPLEGFHTLWDCAIVGLVICGIAVWWYNHRENMRRILSNEINELEVELEP